MELHYHVLLPQKNFLDDLFYSFSGSVVAKKKENGEKNRRAFALGKGFDADVFVYGSYLLFLGERTERAEDSFVSEKEPRKGRVRRSGAVGVVGRCLGREKVLEYGRGETGKDRHFCHWSRENLFAAKRGYGMLFSCILLFCLFGGLTAARPPFLQKNGLATMSFSCRVP